MIGVSITIFLAVIIYIFVKIREKIDHKKEDKDNVLVQDKVKPKDTVLDNESFVLLDLDK